MKIDGKRHRAVCLWLSVLGAVASTQKTAEASKGGDAEKVGAGLFLVAPSGNVLLLQRAGKHNAGTWGLPGGNAEAGDANLLATARREAAEELGGREWVPPHVISGEGILTRRGKDKQKHFTVGAPLRRGRRGAPLLGTAGRAAAGAGRRPGNRCAAAAGGGGAQACTHTPSKRRQKPAACSAAPSPRQVFVAKVEEQAHTLFTAPKLNLEEHSAYRWFPISDLAGLEAEGKLHPVVGKLLKKHHWGQLLAAAGLPGAGGR
ncbi:MAG: hypothetical protein J3K34DRAFT_132112 [Monoraphidium minutum]|nr:MAG: hypothetical protein J3K34DRAFT_132112 [Monoraphidium minutum]